MRPSNQLLRRLEARLSPPLRDALRRAVSLAEEGGVEVYLVGGGVRDLLLGGDHVDLDLVVEGDGIGLASALAEAVGAKVVAHPRFGTAVVEGAGFRLDLARARAEHYERPGALPTVQPASLADDLARRDFTINALALCLGGPKRGELIDPHGGQRDIEQRLVRVLHDGSFRDDATRILRALRYARRLGFQLQANTLSLLERDLSYLDAISGARLRHELEYIAGEAAAGGIVRLAGELGVLAAAEPSLRPGARALSALGKLSEVAPSHRDAVLFCLLLAEVSSAQAETAAARLSLTGRQAEAVRGFLALHKREASLARPALRPSEAVALLASAPAAAIEAFSFVAGEPLAAHRARQYLQEWRFARPRLNGRHVEALGLPHGPRVGEALALLREARLDGRVRTREDEVALVRTLLGEERLAGVGRG